MIDVLNLALLIVLAPLIVLAFAFLVFMMLFEEWSEAHPKLAFCVGLSVLVLFIAWMPV